MIDPVELNILALSIFIKKEGVLVEKASAEDESQHANETIAKVDANNMMNRSSIASSWLLETRGVGLVVSSYCRLGSLTSGRHVENGNGRGG